MKRIFCIITSVLLALCLTACGSSSAVPDETEPVTQPSVSSGESSDASAGTAQAEETQPEEVQPEETLPEDSRILIAYFSRAGENYNVGVIEKGNTQIIAEMIADRTGGDLFRIETVESYPETYEECTQVAMQEQQENARPALSADLDTLDGYDVVFLGYPIWWGDMPMAVYTFLEGHDFSGRTILPFCTNEGSGLASTVSSIAAVTGANVLPGLSVRGTTAQNDRTDAEKRVDAWLQERLGESIP